MTPESTAIHSRFTLLAWVAPVLVMIVPLVLIYFFVEFDSEFATLVAAGCITCGLVIGACIGLACGIVAVVKRERYRKAALLPIAFSGAILIVLIYSFTL